MGTTATRPRAQNVKDYVLRQLATGALSRGDALPTESELAKTLGVGRHSILRAMRELTQAGIVQRIQGRGTFICDQQPQETITPKLDAYALVLPEIRSGIYPSLIKGFGQGAAASHQQSLVSETGMVLHTQSDVILRLLHSHVAGVAIVPALEPMPNYQLEVLRSQKIPVVFCHRRPPEIEAPLITWSWEEVGRLAASTLADLGHQEIAMMYTHPTPVNKAYVKGIRAELTRRGIAIPEDQLIYGEQFILEPNDPGWEHLVGRVLDRPDRPTAVFCSDDNVSEQLYMAAMHRGLSVPSDLSIIGFGSTWRSGALPAKLMVVAIDEIEVGRCAARVLDEMRSGRRPLDSHEVITLPLVLIKGESVGAPRNGT